MLEYITKEGDIIDKIVFDKYGDVKNYLQIVLDMNRGLAKEGPILRAGIKIKLPEIKIKNEKESITLW